MPRFSLYCLSSACGACPRNHRLLQAAESSPKSITPVFPYNKFVIIIIIIIIITIIIIIIDLYTTTPYIKSVTSCRLPRSKSTTSPQHYEKFVTSPQHKRKTPLCLLCRVVSQIPLQRICRQIVADLLLQTCWPCR